MTHRQPDAARHSPHPAHDPEAPEGVAKAWAEAYASADLDALARLYADDATYEHKGVGDRTRETAAIRREMRERLEAHRAAGVRAECRPQRVIGDGHRAILEWTDPLGLPYCSVFRCRHGRIVEHHDYVDARAAEFLYE